MIILIEKNVMIFMRDDVKLSTDIYRQAGEGPEPVLLPPALQQGNLWEINQSIGWKTEG